MSNILFIDDDLDILAINEKYFTKEGYQVKTASNPAAALRLLKTYKPDCIILDIMMPEQNGFQTLKQIRAISSAPVIFLSGRSGENDKIKGLMIGGDDYIVKPYSFRELSARIQVQIRRQQNSSALNIINYPPLSLNLVTHKAYCNNNEIQLTNKEYELLHLLVTKANQVVIFEEISNHLWGVYSEEDRRTIMVTVSRMRKKFEEFDGLENAIESVWSKGYIYNAK